MKADIELNLIHDGENWIAHNSEMTVKGYDFTDLDEDIKRSLLNSGQFSQGSRITVFMGFDFDTIPVWLRQYHNHYFNRFIDIEL